MNVDVATARAARIAAKSAAADAKAAAEIAEIAAAAAMPNAAEIAEIAAAAQSAAVLAKSAAADAKTDFGFATVKGNAESAFYFASRAAHYRARAFEEMGAI